MHGMECHGIEPCKAILFANLFCRRCYVRKPYAKKYRPVLFAAVEIYFSNKFLMEKNELGRISPNEDTENNACRSAMLLCLNQVFTAVLNRAIELNLFDIIAKETENGSFISASHIASKIPTQHSELPNRLERMLRLLASYSLLTCVTHTNSNGSSERVYGVSPIGKYFVSDQSTGSFASFTSATFSRPMSQVWPNFKDAIIDVDNDLFKKVHGMPMYIYTQRDPTMNRIFNKAMTDLSIIDMQSILKVYTRFEGIQILVDVGGGIGQTLNMIISKYPSIIKGINFDLPHVVEKAPTYPGIEHIGGDMYMSVPQGDAIILKAVLHNWPDEKCLSVLKNCHKALTKNGKVIVIDSIVPEESDSDLSKIVSLLDNLMFINHGSRERTANEFETLSKLSGFSRFELVAIGSTSRGIMEFHK
ncbi:hypothetical protein VNO77_34040 [Canavalia gladiata]|uniref:Isoliquiritigenin 2'-O-methyltransferase n=1 Tax=Canavalia gladiata TaxID=3824 RepID=A0AAN9KCZ7_CANGL